MNFNFAVIIATYQRKNNLTPNCIKNTANFLNNQTYKNFKIFLIGDKYENNIEFLNYKELFNNEIYIHNNTECFRNDFFKIKDNLWTSGGCLARYHGIKTAIAEKYDYYLHLDDDDLWTNDHIEKINLVINKFKDVDFLITKSTYCKRILPRALIRSIYYNNYIVRKCDSVHSSWCINLKTLQDLLNLLYKYRINRIYRFKNKIEKEVLLPPFDAVILTHLSNLQKQKKIKCICSTYRTVTKKNDHNVPS
jgi:hypothetical protein